jgi:hypothetical protein
MSKCPRCGKDEYEDRSLRRIERDVEKILSLLEFKPFVTSISFKEITMLPTTGGNTLVYTGTLSPVGALFTTETFTVTSNDPAVLPTVDPTGLIVTVPLPAGWVENAATPLAITYTTTAPASLSATITPSAPVVVPTGIAFVQTT